MASGFAGNFSPDSSGNPFLENAATAEVSKKDCNG